MGVLSIILAEATPVAKAAVSLPNPPAGKQNFYTSIQGTKKSFVEQVKAGRISLPCLIINAGAFVPDTDFGIGDTMTKRFSFGAFYIAQWAGTDGTQDSVNEAAIKIAKAFDAPTRPFNTFLVIEPAQVSSAVEDSINAALLAASSVQTISSSAIWQPGFQTEIS